MTTDSLSEAATKGMKPVRVVIYTRISRDDTGEGEANERQEAACRMFAQMRGWIVVSVHHDISKSGWKKSDRPGWQRVVEMMEAGECDVVLCWKLDRVTRRVRDLIALIETAERTGVSFATTDGMLDLSTPVGRAVATILGAVAQMEVELKAERQNAASRQRAAKGEVWRTGFRAFGYTLAGEVVEEEAALIRKAAEDTLNGTPLRGIVREWNEAGVPTPRKRKNMNGWTHNSVRAILLNPRHAGIATFKGQPIGKGKWEAILSEETHVLLTARLTDPQRSRGDKSQGNKPRNLLSGIATCGVCGSPVEAGSSNGKRVYRCSNPEGEHLNTPREEADSFALYVFQSGVSSTLHGTLLPKRDRSIPKEIWTELEGIKERQKLLTTRWAEGRLTDEQFDLANDSLTARRVEIEAAVEGNEERDAGTLTAEDLEHFRGLDLWGRRRVFSDPRLSITLWPKGRRKNVPIKHQVTMHWQREPGRVFALADERPADGMGPSQLAYAGMARLLLDHQPEGVTTLAKAGKWLREHGHTEMASSGIPSKLSPLIRYDHSASRWTDKG